VAVITGGASGIGRALAEVFLGEGMKVVLADVEEAALAKTVAELSRGGAPVAGVRTDVSSRESVFALADRVYALHGACHVLCNNAGVGSPGVNVWETTPNDWKWVFGVNVMGVVHGIQAFVPRMLASGAEGYVVNTSSGDGGISPLPGQSVYASSKAAVSIITECLEAQLRAQGSKLRASILYPAGGLLATGIWTCDRNRPPELAREQAFSGAPQTLEWFQEAARKGGYELRVQPLDELAQHALAGLRDERFVIMIGLEEAGETLRARAERIAKGELPTDLRHGLGL
jgi:NAD(P)-dependent dehydrogenase (short-subunit alcohol dehydrogenase family)